MSTEPPSSASAAADDRVTRPWSSLAFPNYRLLWAASALGTTGLQMRQFANIWQVYELTGSPLQLGLTGLFQAAPLLVIGLFGGAVADMFDRRKLLMITEMVNLVLALVLGFLTASGDIQVWHIYALTALTAAVNVFGQPARTALIAGVVPRSHLMNAITLLLGLQQGTILVGPLAAGLLVDGWGASSAYFVNAALFIPALVALAFIKTGAAPLEEQPSRLRPSTILEGVRFVWATPILVGLISLDTVATLFGSYRVLLPMFAKDILQVGPVGLGALLSAPAVGGFVGLLGVLGAGNFRRKGRVVLASTMLWALGIAIFGLSTWFLLSLLMAGALGVFNSIGVSARHTTVQLLAPGHLRGRATSVHQIFAQGAPALGFVFIGALAAWVGAPMALVLGGVICGLVVAVVAIRNRPLRDYRA